MTRLAAAALALMTLVSTPPAVAEEPAETKSFVLAHLRLPDAATALRTIVGVERLAAKDERSLDVTGTPAHLQLTAELLAALDVAKLALTRLSTDDDSVIAVIPLHGISSKDAMLAMRELEMRRAASVTEPAAAVVVRDTPERVALAIEALRTADRP